ncbi:MAG: hypothetical protein CL866_07945 [Cycloclasticus sp.]|nr:hypothetical protein [Cycloclasticus sp.]MBG96777.1 hypothetical protein [Cycloclasticus sp.]|tara:strand:- start:4834 stop:5055 length:222 start_codon:yes stop_codon:yes gene_type:complete
MSLSNFIATGLVILAGRLTADALIHGLCKGLVSILAVERFLAMCRTRVNAFSDSSGALIIARNEVENQVLQSD